MLEFCLGFTFMVFLCLFITSFGFLICGSKSSNVRFCLYFSLVLTIGTLITMFYVQEPKKPVTIVKECSFKTSNYPSKVI